MSSPVTETVGRSSCPTGPRRTRWRRPTACGSASCCGWTGRRARRRTATTRRAGSTSNRHRAACRCGSSPSRRPPPDASDDERWIRLASEDPERPGMHATDTLDFMAVLDGEIVLGLDDGEHHLRQGDCVVQRGNAHRWRIVGDRPCTYAVAMVRPVGAGARAGRGRDAVAPGRRARGGAWSPGPTPTAGRTRSSTAPRPSCTSPRDRVACRSWSCGRPGGRVGGAGSGRRPGGLVAARAAQRGHRVPCDRDAGRSRLRRGAGGTPPTPSTSTS